MDMLQIHADARESGNTVFHCFLLRYKPNERIVYGIVEGKDDPIFYQGLIEHHLPDSWGVDLIPSEGKKKVLKAFQNMNWSRYPDKRICFFVDRDLAEFLGGESFSGSNLYVTDNYSIENEVVTFSMMKRVQKEILGITAIEGFEEEILQNIFNSNLTIFREIMAPIMAQILLWRRDKQKVNLDNIRLKNFLTFTNGKICIKPEFSSPLARVQLVANDIGVTASAPDELAIMEKKFRQNQGLEKYIRGKYLLCFFVRCALDIHKNCPLFCSCHKSPPKHRAAFNYKTAMHLLAPRVRCPPSLKEFIQNNYVEFIREVESDAFASGQPQTGLRCHS